MPNADELTFTERMAHFYAREYGFPPVAGRVLEGAAFYDFLAERMPALLTEWHARRDTVIENR